MNSSRTLLAVLLLALCAATCKRETALPPVQTAVEDDTVPVAGGTVLRRLSGDVSTLNPIVSATKYDRLIAYYLYTPIVHLDVNLQPIPGLADKWEISPDGRLYTFHLNPKATFSDGTPIKASDVLFTLKKIVDPASEAAQIAGGFDKLDLATTKVLDDHTIVVGFKETLASQLTQFNNVLPLPEHVYSQGDFRGGWVDRAIGSGPYTLVRRVPGKEIVLQRRKDWWGPPVWIDTILFKVINDDKTAWQAVQRGDVDEAQISSDVWLMESRRPELQKTIDFRRFYTLTYNFIPWNNRHPIFGDRRVRRAMSMCIDLQSVINNLYHGTARAMNGPFTPDEWAYNPDVPVIQYNPLEAQRILNSLGWTDSDKDGILDKNGKPFKFDMLIPGGNAVSSPFGQLLQAELKKIGVQMNIVPLDTSAFMQRVLGGNFEAAQLAWDVDPDPDPFTLFHSSQFAPQSQNIVFYSNPEADKLMDAERTQLDLKKRIPIMRKLHEVLANDQPYTWTLQVSSKWAVNKRLRNVNESKGWGLNLWYPGELGWWIPKRFQNVK
ncbi:MAG TPA: ABC transporter substrate-binding protein [Thermoanaerobaculia bacterium]|nr:ABC transporter substrate-binding protein [Thermoanaerobaculia bacterium]